MKIIIFSDSHDNLLYLEKMISWSKKNNIKKFICLGDVTNQDTFDYLTKNISSEMFLISGNADLYDFSNLDQSENIKFGGNNMTFIIEKIKIIIAHTPQDLNTAYQKKSEKIDFAFYGHTHKPWIENKNDTIFANPGTVGGIYYEASFAVLETDNKKLELKLINKL